MLTDYRILYYLLLDDCDPSLFRNFLKIFVHLFNTALFSNHRRVFYFVMSFARDKYLRPLLFVVFGLICLWSNAVPLMVQVLSCSKLKKKLDIINFKYMY